MINMFVQFFVAIGNFFGMFGDLFSAGRRGTRSLDVSMKTVERKVEAFDRKSAIKQHKEFIQLDKELAAYKAGKSDDDLQINSSEAFRELLNPDQLATLDAKSE